MRNEEITGVILAGGKSLRMGKSKSPIEINSEIRIRTLHNLIKMFCSEIIVNTNFPEEYSFLNEKIVPDEINDIGPIGGIISCLRESAYQKNLVVSSNMPMVPAGLLQLLIEKKDSAEFVVPASGSRVIEPLCAIYDKSLIPVLEEMIALGDYKIQNLRFHCQTAYVQVYNGNNIFKNLNSPKDLVKNKP